MNRDCYLEESRAIAEMLSEFCGPEDDIAPEENDPCVKMEYSSAKPKTMTVELKIPMTKPPDTMVNCK